MTADGPRVSADEIMRPPMLPYGETPYFDYATGKIVPDYPEPDISKVSMRTGALVAELRTEKGGRHLYLNGREEPLILYRGAINERGTATYGRFMTGFDQAGVRLAEVSLSLRQIWRPDGSIAEAVRAYIEAQTSASSELEAKSKLVGQWIMLGIYRIAAMLSQSGNRVHLMYWDEKALIENLGSGTADVLATLLGNGDALQMYGSVLNKDLSEALQSLLQKFINQKALQLYSNEIKGVDAFLWKPFPRALIVSDGEIRCDTIEDKITEVKELLEDMKQ